MKFKQKRLEAKLKPSYIAYKLGITLKDYAQIEKGIKGISTDKIELFSKLTNQPEISRLEQSQLLREAMAWYDSVDLDKEIEKFGYTRKSFSQISGISGTKVYDYCNHKRYVNDGALDFYLFFKDENNKRYSNDEKRINNLLDNLNNATINNDPRFIDITEDEEPEIAINDGIIQEVESYDTSENLEQVDITSINGEETPIYTSSEPAKPSIEVINQEEPKKEEHDFKDDYIEYLSGVNKELKNELEILKASDTRQEIRIKELEARVDAKNDLISNLERLLNNLGRNN